MVWRSCLAIIVAVVLPLAAQKRKEKPVMIPVPDASWQPIARPASSADPADVLSVKRAASRAHQAGQNRVTAAAGSASPEELLAWGANQLVLPAGMPAGQSDYLTRACWFNGQGRPVRDILLLESRLPEPSKTAAEALLTLQRDFDLASIETLGAATQPPAEEKSVESFRLGEARYRVLLIAPSDFWPENVLDVLLDYINAGGRVVFSGRQPLSIQRLLFRTGVVRVGDAPEDIERGLSYALGRDLRVTLGDTGDSAPAILYQHRSDGKRDYYFVLNADSESAVAARLGISVGGSMEEWDLRTGLVTPLRTPAVEIPAGGSVAIVVVR